jgi:RHS repeat-associated protein
MGVTTAYVYDGNDRLLNEKVNGTAIVTYGYDGNGSTIAKTENGLTSTYVWNDDKRLVSATVNGTAIAYKYNDQGIRVSSTVDGVETRYLLDEGITANVWEEYSPNGTVQMSYVYGNDLISQTQGTQASYYLVDGLGSTRLLTDAQGQVLNAYGYEAFGETVSQSGTAMNAYQYAGEQFDGATGDYYLRQRFYDPSSGRFGRMDTYEGNLSNPLTLSKYIYTSANPVNQIDPTGYFFITEWIVAHPIISSLIAASVLGVGAAYYELSSQPLTRTWVRMGFLSKKSYSESEGGADSAAVAILKEINPVSIRENVEYGGEIVKAPDTGRYHYTGPFKGTRDGVTTTSWFSKPSVADYHTHSDDRASLIEKWFFGGSYIHQNGFSGPDLDTSDDKMLIGYLANPLGEVLKYDPRKPIPKKMQGLFDARRERIETIRQAGFAL